MYNRVIIVGNLTRDVEFKYLSTGNPIANLGLASNRRYKRQDGTQVDETCFIDVKIFGRTAEVANQYLRKGSKVLIEGRLNYESWSDATGAKKSKHTITADNLQMLDSKSSSSEDYSNDYKDGGSYQNASYQKPRQDDFKRDDFRKDDFKKEEVKKDELPSIDLDEEIPF